MGLSLERKGRSISGAYRWTRTPHRDVIGVEASLGKQLLNVPVGKREAQVPADLLDDLRFELPPLKRPETEGVSRSIAPTYQIAPPKLQHIQFFDLTYMDPSASTNKVATLPCTFARLNDQLLFCVAGRRNENANFAFVRNISILHEV
jgi:hypothetical protein